MNETLREIVTRIAKKHSDPEKCRKMVRKIIDADAELRTSIIDEAITTAIMYCVTDVRHKDRYRMKFAATTRGIDAISAASKGVSLYDSMAVGSRWLGDCGQADLLDAAEAERESGHGHFEVAAGLTALASKCKAGKALRDSLPANRGDKVYYNAIEAYRKSHGYEKTA